MLRVEVEQRHEPAIDFQRPRMIAAFERRDQFDRFLRERIGEAGNPALRAKIQALERDVVEAREQDIAIAERVAEIGEAARVGRRFLDRDDIRSEEHTSELPSLMRISYAVICLKKKNKQKTTHSPT